MNQIIGTVALSLISSYGSTFAIKYAVECVTYQVVKKGSQVVKDSAKYAIYGSEKKIPRVIEYELINFDENGNPIMDETSYVTSKHRTKSIEKSWIDTTTKTPSPVLREPSPEAYVL